MTQGGILRYQHIRAILRAVETCGSQTAAAKMLGISRRAVYDVVARQKDLLKQSYITFDAWKTIQEEILNKDLNNLRQEARVLKALVDYYEAPRLQTVRRANGHRTAAPNVDFTDVFTRTIHVDGREYDPAKVST